MFDKLSIKLFDRRTAFEVLREDWQRLFASAEAAPFASWEWTTTWFEYFGENGLPFILAAYSGSVLVGLLPLYSQQKKVFGMPVKKLAFMNSEIGGAAYLDVLALPNEKKAATDAFLDFLETRSEINLLELESIAADSVLLEEIRRHEDQSEFRLRVAPHDVCQYAEVGSTDDFLKRIYNDTAKKKLKRIKKLPGFEFRRTTENVEAAFQRFVKLHDGNWTEKGGSEVSGHRRLLDFHMAAALANAQNSAIFFDEIWVENECVASLYGFQADNKYFYYSSGYDERLSKLSPMVTLYNLSIENGLQNGVRIFDFLCGGQGYKKHWANAENKLLTVRLSRKNWLMAIADNFSELELKLRDAGKRLLPAEMLESVKKLRRKRKRETLSELPKISS